MTCVNVFQWGNNSSGCDNIPEVAELPANFKRHSFSQVGEQAKETLLLSEQRKPETHLQLSRAMAGAVRSNHSLTSSLAHPLASCPFLPLAQFMWGVSF